MYVTLKNWQIIDKKNSNSIWSDKANKIVS